MNRQPNSEKPATNGANEPVLKSARHISPRLWRQLTCGDLSAVCITPPASARMAPTAPPAAVFPGAFNPLHDGHRRMAEVAADVLRVPVDFEISIENVDKARLSREDVVTRLQSFTDRRVWLTRAATFLAKSELFPGATLIVGADTIVRIAEPAYYGNDLQRCLAALREIAARGCRFLVFGRRTPWGFQTLDKLALPGVLRGCCEGVAEADFRCDLSSTDLRGR